MLAQRRRNVLCLLCNSRLNVAIGLILGQRRRRWTHIKPLSKELLGSRDSNSLNLLINYTEGKVMWSKVKSHVLSPRPIKFVIFSFLDVLGVCFVIRDEPYGVNTLTVGPTIRLISILIHCVQHRPVIEPTLAQGLVFVLKCLHRRIPQPQTQEAFGSSFSWVWGGRSGGN